MEAGGGRRFHVQAASDVGGVAEAAAEQGEHASPRASTSGLGHHPQQVARGRRSRAACAPGGGLEAPAAVVAAAAPPRASRWRAGGIGDDQDPGPGDVGAPAEVEVVAEVGRWPRRTRRAARNRSARTSVAPPGTKNTSRTASCCSWSSSPRLGERGRATPVLSIDRADLEQRPRVVPVDQLRPDDARVGAERLLDQRRGRRPGRGRRRRGRAGRTRRPRPRRATSLAAAPNPGLSSRRRTRASGSDRGDPGGRGPRRCRRR